MIKTQDFYVENLFDVNSKNRETLGVHTKFSNFDEKRLHKSNQISQKDHQIVTPP